MRDYLLTKYKGMEKEYYQAFVAKHFERRMSTERKSQLREYDLCTYCERPGHRKAECPGWRHSPCTECGSLGHHSGHRPTVKAKPDSAVIPPWRPQPKKENSERQQ